VSGHRLLFLGTGSIAASHAERFKAIPGIVLAGAADTNLARARAYAEAHGIRHAFGSLDAALDWGEFDAAVNATPDPVHYPTTMALLAARRPVFCEKPLAVNHGDAFAMAEAAEQAGLINMVNLTYRNAGALQEARRLVLDGAIGAVRHVQASYLQSWLTGNHWGDWRTDERWLWRLSTAHGSKGVLGDVGIHIVDFATYGTALEIASLSARLHAFAKAPGGAIGPYVLDANDSCVMDVEFAGGALGVIHMSRFATGHRNDLSLEISGTLGALRVWANSADSTLDVCLGPDIHTQAWKRVDTAPAPSNGQRFAAALAAGKNGEPDFRRAAELQKVLDLCLRSDAEGRRLAVA
jgi:predicted dehydrogenase